MSCFTNSPFADPHCPFCSYCLPEHSCRLPLTMKSHGLLHKSERIHIPRSSYAEKGRGKKTQNNRPLGPYWNRLELSVLVQYQQRIPYRVLGGLCWAVVICCALLPMHVTSFSSVVLHFNMPCTLDHTLKTLVMFQWTAADSLFFEVPIRLAGISEHVGVSDGIKIHLHEGSP